VANISLSTKVIYFKDDLVNLAERYLISNEFSSFGWVSGIMRQVIFNEVKKLIPEDIEIEVRKAGQRRNPYFPD